MPDLESPAPLGAAIFNRRFNKSRLKTASPLYSIPSLSKPKQNNFLGYRDYC